MCSKFVSLSYKFDCHNAQYVMNNFSGDFGLEPAVAVKQEPVTDVMMNTSASVPIPGRRAVDANEYRDFSLEFETSQSPLNEDLCYMGHDADSIESTGLWGNRISHCNDDLKSEALIHMDDYDIFQVDKADLIQGPTLAELNANDENLLREINFDDLLLPEEHTYESHKHILSSHAQMNNSNHINNNSSVLIATSCPHTGMMFYREGDLSASVPLSNFDSYGKRTIATLSPTSQTSSNSPISQSSPLHMSALQQKHSTLHELLMKRETYVSPERMLGHSIPSPSTPSTSPKINLSHTHITRLSSSAPTHLGPEQIWQRREPRKHLLSTSSLVEAGSTSSLSTGGILSPDPQDLSHDEVNTDEDSDYHYEDFSSDNGDSDDDYECGSTSSPTSKKERYFWQYNVQAKGPKGQRLVMKSKMEDPHKLYEVTDPVFSPDCSMRGIKHSGKARKGDGNDLTPNPRKLFNIGKELNKLSRTINDMTPVSELPFNVRPTSRKEKNKLASRACRLKKKAQHEANKIKLSGLEVEHKRLLSGISQAKHILAAKLNESSNGKQEELSVHLDKLMKCATKIKIAGLTTEYVNKILERYKGAGIAPIIQDG